MVTQRAPATLDAEHGPSPTVTDGWYQSTIQFYLSSLTTWLGDACGARRLKAPLRDKTTYPRVP